MTQEIVECETIMEVLDDLERRAVDKRQWLKAINGFITLKARSQNRPVSGMLELTPLCNLDCKMCYVHLRANQLGKDERLLSVQEWKTIIKQAVDAGMAFTTITGGECLTYPGFKEIYQYLFSFGIRPDILTNGRLLTEEMVAFLKKYPPGVIQISLYGSSEDAYEAVTGHRAFSEVMAGIDRVKAAGLNVMLTIMPNRFIQEDLKALLDAVHSLNVPYAIGSSTLQAREGTGRDIDEYAVELETYLALKRMEREYLADFPNNTALKPVPQYILKERLELKGLPCSGGHSSFHINWKGHLSSCVAFADSVGFDIRSMGFVDAYKDALIIAKQREDIINVIYRKHLIWFGALVLNCAITGGLCVFITVDGLLGLFLTVAVCAIVPNIVFYVLYCKTNMFKESAEFVRHVIRR